MTTIKSYTAENVAVLKLWLNHMAEKKETKYFELFVDGLRVLPKTARVEEFDEHTNWVNEHTKVLRVLVYNTQNSHRSEVHEFRTENFVEGDFEKVNLKRKSTLNEEEVEKRVQAAMEEYSRKQKMENLKRENAELTKRLANAESYIAKLEAKLETTQTGKQDVFLEVINRAVSSFSKQAAANPKLPQWLSGLMQGGSEREQSEQEEVVAEEGKQEEAQASFRKRTVAEPVNEMPVETKSEVKNETNFESVALGSVAQSNENKNQLTLFSEQSLEGVASESAVNMTTSEIKSNAETLVPEMEVEVSVSNESKTKQNILFKTENNLNDIQSAKLLELYNFFKDNPLYIDTVHGLVREEMALRMVG